jgi:hypothetical protein
MSDVPLDMPPSVPPTAPSVPAPSVIPSTPKYKLSSPLSQQVSLDTVGEKIMDTPINISLREFCAVSSDLGNWISDKTRKRRTPIQGIPATSASIAQDKAPLYAVASGKIKVKVEDAYQIDALLDEGSEINLLSLRAFNVMKLPIDENIRWIINGYDGRNIEGERNVVGVCHDVRINVCGIETPCNLFVVRNTKHDLILGRPWSQLAQADFMNEPNGTYSLRLKSLDGTRIVKTTLCGPDGDARNRRTVRDPEDLNEDLKA